METGSSQSPTISISWRSALIGLSSAPNLSRHVLQLLIEALLRLPGGATKAQGKQ